MERSNLESMAAALYDGGWRAEDRDQMIDEYELTEEEASEIAEVLKEFGEEE